MCVPEGRPLLSYRLGSESAAPGESSPVTTHFTPCTGGDDGGVPRFEDRGDPDPVDHEGYPWSGPSRPGPNPTTPKHYADHPRTTYESPSRGFCGGREDENC